jgi:hypothetical protein
MLRRRIEKLERDRSLTADLVSRWESQAKACLSCDEWALVEESFSASGRKPRNSPAHLAAIQRYDAALAATIIEVRDDELDRMILSLEPEQKLAGKAIA